MFRNQATTNTPPHNKSGMSTWKTVGLLSVALAFLGPEMYSLIKYFGDAQYIIGGIVLIIAVFGVAFAAGSAHARQSSPPQPAYRRSLSTTSAKTPYSGRSASRGRSPYNRSPISNCEVSPASHVNQPSRRSPYSGQNIFSDSTAAGKSMPPSDRSDSDCINSPNNIDRRASNTTRSNASRASRDRFGADKGDRSGRRVDRTGQLLSQMDGFQMPNGNWQQTFKDMKTKDVSEISVEDYEAVILGAGIFPI